MEDDFLGRRWLLDLNADLDRSLAGRIKDIEFFVNESLEWLRGRVDVEVDVSVATVPVVVQDVANATVQGIANAAVPPTIKRRRGRPLKASLAPITKTEGSNETIDATSEGLDGTISPSESVLQNTTSETGILAPMVFTDLFRNK